MAETIIQPPRTIMEVYKSLPESTLAELIDGIIYMSPSPIRRHQLLVGKLFSQLFEFVEKNNLGEVYVAPFDVYLDEHTNAVQPDIIYISKKNLGIVQDHIHGVPDMLFEVLSEGNKDHDLKKKKDLYERFGVTEYWIIDPETKEATGYKLKEGKYTQFGRSPGKLRSGFFDAEFEF